MKGATTGARREGQKKADVVEKVKEGLVRSPTTHETRTGQTLHQCCLSRILGLGFRVFCDFPIIRLAHRTFMANLRARTAGGAPHVSPEQIDDDASSQDR